MNEEIGLLSIMDNLIVLENGKRYSIEGYIDKLQQENQQLKDRITKAINDIDLVIELIKQQPTEDDSWILGRLNSFKIILKEVE